MPKLKEEKNKCVDNNKPFPLRLGDLKPLYHSEAMRLDRSMHWLMLQGLKDYAKTFKK